ncbi:hypothetical protein BH11BAC7_BH11BAC7_21380 [soil metagenome]
MYRLNTIRKLFFEMERKARGVRQDGKRYDKLFNRATGVDYVVKKDAELTDTIDLFPEYVPRYAYQAERLVAEKADKNGDVHNSCYNIWHFLVNHIAYQPDTPGIEQVRSPDRLWSDRLGDCDCFAFTISCYLYLLKIKHILRITQYKEKDGFQHIYVVVPHRGKEIIIDACLESFNVEVPYINKIDKVMDLHFLNGIDSTMDARSGGSIDADELLASYQWEDLGSIKSFLQKAKTNVKTVVQKTGTAVKKTGAAVKKSIHVINRVNPATTVLRMGLLTAMKTNMFKVSENLRYAYLSDADAAKKGLNLARHARFKKVREKLEKIFFGAGGKPENLKEAILTGKGNENKEVALSGYGSLRGIGEINSQTSLQEILGEQMFRDEMPPQGINGTGTLGVVAAAAVAAASGILATIAAILKNIGDIKNGGAPGPDAAIDAMDNSTGTDETPTASAGDELPDEYIPDATRESTPDAGEGEDGGSAPPQTTPPGEAKPTEKTFAEKAKEFYAAYKTPIWIVGGVVVTVGGVLIARHFMKKSGAKKEKSKAVNGVPRKGKYAGSKVLRKLKMKPLK